MNEYASIYNEYGLKEMIKHNKNMIKEKQKEFQKICEEKKNNHLYADGLEEVIQEDITFYKNEILELEEAVRIQKDKLKKDN